MSPAPPPAAAAPSNSPEIRAGILPPGRIAPLGMAVCCSLELLQYVAPGWAGKPGFADAARRKWSGP